MRKTSILVLNIYASASEEEIRTAVGREDEVKVLNLQKMGRGCQMARIQVPIPTALQLVQAGSIQIGWSNCKVRSLEKKDAASPRCFRCLHLGHFAAACKEEAVGKGCYRCGAEGHLLRDCTRDPKCPLCSREEGRDAGHVVGSKGCIGAAQSTAQRRRRGPPAP